MATSISKIVASLKTPLSMIFAVSKNGLPASYGDTDELPVGTIIEVKSFKAGGSIWFKITDTGFEQFTPEK